ncbi:MAG: error-prone DNA polymerase [Burkholderiales bacterium]
MASLPEYAELHCISNFSFLRGASHAEELVARAAALGYAALAITDECSLAGIVRAHVAAKAQHLKLVVGSELLLDDGTRLVLLAPDRRAYGALSSLISTGRRRSAKGAYALSRSDVEACADSGLLALWAGAEGVPGLAGARWLAECFPGRAWIAVELLCGADDRAQLAALQAMSAASGLPLVAAGDVHMHLRSRRRLQDMLTAIRLRRPLAQCGRDLHANGERHLRLRARLAQLYPPALLAETVRIAERCTFSLDSLRYEYPEEIVPAGETPTTWLRKLTEQGLAWRFPGGVDDALRARIDRELALIAELGYEAFFLTVHDVVKFARAAGILCQGRGSAANSAVCYCLGITTVHPRNTLFERFISRERNEPPDIDVDFEHERREEVIQYIYAKYGRDRAAIAATVIRYGPKSALRDAGKALGFAPAVVDRLAKSLAWWDGRQVLPERLREAGIDIEVHAGRQLAAMVAQLVEFPRHLSQHTGGFVISRGSLAQIVPIENAAMRERSVIQWDKDDLESLGLLKVDVLALGMLSAIRRALQLAGIAGMDAIPRDDAAVYAMISRADTVGVFQIESRAQMSMLPRLKPAQFYDLVIEVAIVRPGPIQGGMVHPYLRRRQGLERIEYPSEAVKGVLERTLGVPIFQEQVMQLAVVAAGFTPGEADQLRRSMAAWKRKGGLGHLESRLIEGMLARGYTREFADAIYRQICGFGDYGFPESHSVSFAQLAYVSAWLKCHRPAAFLAALLNSQPMGFYRPAQLIQDARRHGVEVLPVDVCSSDRDCTLEGGAVRLGLGMVGGLAGDAAARIAAARPFASVQDLARRAALDRGALGCLARAGALATLAGHRRLARWHAAGLDAGGDIAAAAPAGEAAPLLDAPAEGEELVLDYASLGFTLGRHPLALLRPQLARRRWLSAARIGALAHGARARAAGMVTGRQRPGTASGVVFVTLEDETGCVNVVVWRDLVERQRGALLGASLLGVDGILERNGEVVHLLARRLEDCSALLGRLAARSRDFH